MRRALAVVWFAIRGVYDELFPLAGMGLLWFLMAVVPPGLAIQLAGYLGLGPGLAIPLILVSLILAPPATAAVYHVTSLIAREKRIEFNYFWQGFKAYLGRSWAIAGVLIVVGAILAIDVMFFFDRLDNTAFLVMFLVSLWAVVFWVAIQIYLYPLMVSLEDKSLLLIFKNAALLTLAYPLFSLIIVIVFILITVLSVISLILMPTLWMPFVALLNSRALASSLRQVEEYRQAQKELDEEREEES
jgi:uncharacterized membrane protein YesL